MNTNRYAPPKALVDREPVIDIEHAEYAGFWIRVGAGLIDMILVLAITTPLLIAIYGWAYFDAKGFVAGPADFVLRWLAPAVATILFWLNKQATPGKMAVSAKIVDARTGGTLSVAQATGRYLAHFVSGLFLGLGFIWIAFDSRKRGWHDMLAGTVVVRSKGSATKSGPNPP
jgi:uncharacterized RDD family membrane protein YckC